MYAMALAAALAASQPATPPAVPPAEQAPPAVAVQQPPHIPDLAEIMAIPPELQVLLQERVIAPGGTRQEQLERLVVLVFDQTALAIEYDNDRTRTVAETWRDRRANCVSYTLLFVALARAAGMDAYVQEAGEVLAWYRDAGVIYSASHVNAGIRSGMRQQTVDVDRNILATRGRPRGVSDARALAHVYNNRGAELMADGDLAGARALLEAALMADRKFVPAWNNMGVLQQRLGDERKALEALHTARRLAPEHASTLSNLVNAYQRNGQPEQAARYAARLEEIRRTDPFAQFMLALECEDEGDYGCAIARYQRAIRIQGGEHAFHFGLARAYFLDGQLEHAQREMAKAASLGDTERVRNVYRRKLESLERWRMAQASRAPRAR
ncbi:tetratricopeptide repeat protein [Pseudoxanthomonas suwonensis]|uniref:tetratricopeptide repeat protein n=1 Tax=Pseudoxanthomonas suwonensis TaxID=314722 RepID=UPI00138F5EFD|nr:tetratricopeptide repeat protein [Pseudoxanthomonas suwonensis]KAF1703354.1 transglutaminase [Pseudoxanthomonas suwonensis]